MAKATIQIRTDTDVKEAADSIFQKLGITMSDGINIFLRQVILSGGLPFEVKLPVPAQETKSRKQQQELIKDLSSKYKSSTFYIKRFLQQKNK